MQADTLVSDVMVKMTPEPIWRVVEVWEDKAIELLESAPIRLERAIEPRGLVNPMLIRYPLANSKEIRA